MKHISLSNLSVQYIFGELDPNQTRLLTHEIATREYIVIEQQQMQDMVQDLRQLPIYSPSETSLRIVRAYSRREALPQEI